MVADWWRPNEMCYASHVKIWSVHCCEHDVSPLCTYNRRRKLVQIPRLNSTFPSLPPLSQNCSSRDCAETACLWGKAAKARGRAKIEVPRINPTPESVTNFWLVSRTAYLDLQVESSLAFASTTVSAVTAPVSKAAAP